MATAPKSSATKRMHMTGLFDHIAATDKVKVDPQSAPGQRPLRGRHYSAPGDTGMSQAVLTGKDEQGRPVRYGLIMSEDAAGKPIMQATVTRNGQTLIAEYPIKPGFRDTDPSTLDTAGVKFHDASYNPESGVVTRGRPLPTSEAPNFVRHFSTLTSGLGTNPIVDSNTFKDADGALKVGALQQPVAQEPVEEPKAAGRRPAAPSVPV